MSHMLPDIEASKSEYPSIDWTKYAKHYDQMCNHNPSYWEMINSVLTAIGTLNLPESSRILDIGAGTGNLLFSLAKERNDLSLFHLDFDRGMNELASAKYNSLGQKNTVEIVACAVEEANFPDNHFDVITTTNALYATSEPQKVLSTAYDWIKPGGQLVIVDFGRPQNVNDWAWYMAKTSLVTQGIAPTIKLFRENWEVARQNKITAEAQDSGNYWLHNTSEFKIALEKSGFIVNKLDQCYRGYSDIAVCSKPH